jgi:carboxylesterase type B
VIDATTPAAVCNQVVPASQDILGFILAANPYRQSEDYLVMDVLVPTNQASRKLAVLVQIHGGDYDFGNAQFFPGDATVNQSNGALIYVSIQYRLGIFGFLAGGAVVHDGNQNSGLLDQRAALEWVCLPP